MVGSIRTAGFDHGLVLGEIIPASSILSAISCIILFFLLVSVVAFCRIGRLLPVSMVNLWPGPVGPVTSAAGPLGKGKVSGSVECCSPVAAGAAGSTRTWA